MQQQVYYKQDTSIFIQLIRTANSEILTFWSLIYLDFLKSRSCEG